MSSTFRLSGTIGSYIEVVTESEYDTDVTAENISITPLKGGMTSAICYVSGLWTVTSLPEPGDVFHQLLMNEKIELNSEDYALTPTMFDDSNTRCIVFGVVGHGQMELSIGLDNCFLKRTDIEKIHQKNITIDDLQNSISSNSYSNNHILHTRTQFTAHKNTERFATNRENLLKTAIHLLSKYPDECRGERKEISPEKWRDCILAHKDEVPPLTIANEEVILKHLRAAANGKV